MHLLRDPESRNENNSSAKLRIWKNCLGLGSTQMDSPFFHSNNNKNKSSSLVFWNLAFSTQTSLWLKALWLNWNRKFLIYAIIQRQVAAKAIRSNLIYCIENNQPHIQWIWLLPQSRKHKLMLLIIYQGSEGTNIYYVWIVDSTHIMIWIIKLSELWEVWI